MLHGPTRARGLSVLLLASAPNCAQPQDLPAPLELESVSPKVLTGVSLNEPLVLSFSEELERTSVTRSSVRVVGRDGRVARGERIVEKNQLRFLPDPVLAPDLSDGGFRPGQTYFVELAGFPRADGIRSQSGVPLRATLRFELSTAAVEEDGLGSSVFLDRTPDQGKPMRFTALAPAPEWPEVRIGPYDPIELEGEEPIDPATVSAGDFVLRAGPAERGGALGEPIPLTAVLRDNRDKHEWPPRGRTILQLLPHKSLAPGRYVLTIDPGSLRLRDFSGHPIVVLAGNAPVRRMGVLVSALETAQPQGELLLEFLDPALRSSSFVPNADGTAHWSRTGRVEIRYPAAAGSGSDGAVRLEGREARRDVQATRLVVPQGARCELDPSEGLVVLRSQGSLEIAGALVRKSGSTPLAPLAPQSLSAWLEQARREDVRCTVLIAGGDLRISGEVECSGPLLLVAGGRVRSSGLLTVGGVHVPLGELARLADSAVILLPCSGALSLVPPLALDPPLANPLREPVVFAVRSNPLPPSGRVARWHPVPEVGGSSGSGSLRVRYVAERAAPGPAEGLHGESPYEIVVDDPALLLDSRTLRLQIELVARPGGSWDPPWLDHVRLSWDQPDPREGR